MKTIDDVKKFWSANPLFTGESSAELGSKEFFEEHRLATINDCLAGRMDERIFEKISKESKILDLGCGPGFWIIEFAARGFKNIHAADLTESAIDLVKKRTKIYNAKVTTYVQNAENLSFEDGSFDHVNCQGVVHHSPDTEKCVYEICRILKKGGTASISVYYRNILLRHWSLLRFTGIFVSMIGGKFRGRGREKIFNEKSPDEIVRIYDGIDNPIGKSYTKVEYQKMLEKHFIIDEIFFHFFPARSLPAKLPGWIHRLLDRHLPFMIYANVTKL